MDRSFRAPIFLGLQPRVLPWANMNETFGLMDSRLRGNDENFGLRASDFIRAWVFRISCFFGYLGTWVFRHLVAAEGRDVLVRSVPPAELRVSGRCIASFTGNTRHD